MFTLIRTVSINGSTKTAVYPPVACNNFRAFNYSGQLMYIYSDPNDDNTRIEVDDRIEVPILAPSDRNTPAPRYKPEAPVFYAMLAAVTVGNLKTVSQ